MLAPTHAMRRRPVSAGNCGNEHFWRQTPPFVTDAHCGRSAQPPAHLVRLITGTYVGASGDGCVGHGRSAGGGAGAATPQPPPPAPEAFQHLPQVAFVGGGHDGGMAGQPGCTQQHVPSGSGSAQQVRQLETCDGIVAASTASSTRGCESPSMAKMDRRWRSSRAPVQVASTAPIENLLHYLY